MTPRYQSPAVRPACHPLANGGVRRWLGWLMSGCGLALAGLLPAAVPDKSGVKPSVISLPSGAGSIEGLGESFEPQLNTGSSSYGVGIALPPGRAGLQPKLRLTYNSGLGNSFVGLGWSLEIPCIKRQTDKGFPSYTSADVFVFQGEELVPLSNAEGDWRCENESAFQRFRQLGTNAWERTERDGTRHVFGQFRGPGNRWSAVVHPAPPAGSLTAFDRTYCWGLNTTIDLHGNRIEYEYLSPTGDPDSSGVLYPSRITYSHSDGNYHEVRFRYEDRPDRFEDYRATLAVVIGKRLAGIEIFSFYDGIAHPVRAYDLEYVHRPEDGIAVAPGSLDLGVSTLKRIVQRDRSGDPKNFLPPLLFEYSSIHLAAAQLYRIPPPELDIGEASGNVQIADVDGDSLPDLIKTGESFAGEQIVCLNRGEFSATPGVAKALHFSRATTVVPFSSNFRLSDPDSTLTDLDGDGLVDFVRIEEGDFTGKALQIFANNSRLDGRGSLGFANASRVQRGAPRRISFSDPALRQMDVNFDKQSDFLSFQPDLVSAFYYYFRHRDDGVWTELGPVPVNPDMNRFHLSFATDGAPNPQVHLADMNGDRLQDLVYLDIEGGGIGATLTVRYWPYRALGQWGDMRVMALPVGDPFPVGALDPRDVIVQDLTGDGLADLAILRSDGGPSSSLELRVNVAGRHWTPPFIKPGLPRHLPRDPLAPTTFRQADLNANGSTDLIWRNRAIGDDSFQWLELMPGGKPNLLTRIDNSLGKRTEITYGNAVDDMIRAREAGFPWQTWCPFPVQVVRRIRTTCGLDLDGLPDSPSGAEGAFTTDQYISDFQYRDAYYDGFEREFRGFAFAQRVDYGDDFLLDTNLTVMVRAPGWDPAKTPTGQVSGPTLVTRFRYLTGAADGQDNDEYPDGWNGALLVDEVTPQGGREEEILKGRQVWEEKLDPWALHDLSGAGLFDRGCWLVFNSTNAAERSRMTPDDYVFSRIRQEWTVRRLYRPDDPGLAPPGCFGAASPSVGVRDGLGGSGRSVSFAFVSSVTNEVIEANGVLQTALGYPARTPLITAQSSDYDDYGNETVQRDFGVVNDAGYDDERFTLTDFALDGEALNHWILNQPSRIRLTDENGVFVSETRNYYDGSSFLGQPLHVMGARALLHRVEQIITGDSPIPDITAQSDRPGDPRVVAGTLIQKARNSYDRYGNLLTTVDPLGNPGDLSAGHAHQLAYDSTFQTYPVSETILVGQGKPDLMMSAGYDLGFGVLTSSTDFNGNVTSYEYDSFARLVAIVKLYDTAQFPTALFEYLPADPTRFRIYRYNRGGVLTVETSGGARPASRVISRLREESGEPGTHVTVSYTDGGGRKLAEVKEGDTPGRWVVNTASAYNRRMSAQSCWLPYEIVSGSDDSAPPQFGELWPAGRPPLTDSSGHATVKTDIRYDPLGREIITINPPETLAAIGDDSARTHASTQILPLEMRLYDEEDNNVGGSYAGTPMVQLTDGLGRLIQVHELARLNDDGTPSENIRTWPTRYRYDLNDRLVHIRDSQDNEKWFRYDGLGRKLFMNDPDRGVMFYTYDDASNLRETLDAKRQRITYTYDGVNRLLTEKYHDGLPLPPWRSVSPLPEGGGQGEGATHSVVYHYDTPFPDLPQGDNTLATGRNTKGFLSWVEDLSGEEHTSYDQRGRVESVVKRIPDPELLSRFTNYASLVSYRTAFAYDSLDRVTRLTYPDNDEITHQYNARNLLQRIPGGPTGSILSNITYRASAQLEQIDYGNGVRTTYAYDPRLRLTSLFTHHVSRLTDPLINFVYDFDGVSNIRQITDARPASAVPAGDPRRNTQIFAYDDLYRLTRAQYSFETPGQPLRDDGVIHYRYDRIGNMLAQTSTIAHFEKGLSVTDLGEMSSGGSAGRFNRKGRTGGDPPGPHTLTSIANPKSQIANRHYPYDSNGNMTVIDGLTNTWDFKDRLVRVESAAMLADYRYDYTDRRIIKHVHYQPGVTNHAPRITTVYVNKYFEIREHDAPTKYVWNGETRVARVTGSLNTDQRIQRLRLWPGWNLCSVAVSGSPLPLGEGAGVRAAFKWDQPTLTWLPVAANETLAAGTVLWLHATTNATVIVTGAYTPPVNTTMPTGPSFQPGAGLEALPLLGVRVNVPLWKFDGLSQTWLVRYGTNFPGPYDFPATLAAGVGFLARADVSTTLEVSESALRIRYYHQDHLGSSSALSDSLGRLVEQNAFYTFGHPRREEKLRIAPEAYSFAHKEKDAESDLGYFETRFLQARIARFTRVDPLDATQQRDFLQQPQRFDTYAFCMNRPLVYHDPDGQAAFLIPLVIKAVVVTYQAYNIYDSSKTAVEGINAAREGKTEEALTKAGELAAGLIAGRAGKGVVKLAEKSLAKVQTKWAGKMIKEGQAELRALRKTIDPRTGQQSLSRTQHTNAKQNLQKMAHSASKDLVETTAEEGTAKLTEKAVHDNIVKHGEKAIGQSLTSPRNDESKR